MAMRRFPPLRALEAFIRVARLGSAKAAAQELALSPSALSRRISNLEDFVGKKLFRRQNQQMLLNDEGTALFESIAPIMDDLAKAIENQLDDSRILRLRLGVLPLFGSQRLFPRLAELKRMYPLLHIDINTENNGENLLGDTLDAAIILSDKPDSHLHQVQLDTNHVYAIIGTESAEKIGKAPDADILSQQTFMLHKDMPLSLQAWKKAINMEGLSPAAIDIYDSGPLMLEAAAQGLGIAIMHSDHLDRSHDNRLTRLYDVEVESPYSYWFVCKPKALESRPVRLFHNWLMKENL